jgi:hypothetical protein
MADGSGDGVTGAPENPGPGDPGLGADVSGDDEEADGVGPVPGSVLAAADPEVSTEVGLFPGAEGSLAVDSVGPEVSAVFDAEGSVVTSLPCPESAVPWLPQPTERKTSASAMHRARPLEKADVRRWVMEAR